MMNALATSPPFWYGLTANLARRMSSRHFHACRLLRAQNSLPAAYYRGGTSRAVMFRQQDLPENREEWDDIFRGVIGSPDPNGRQLDGIGGGVSSLSKICVVGPSSHKDADVDYTFAAVGIKTTEVDFSSNCGNMTAAVGPFAIESGTMKPQKQARGGDSTNTIVRIHNTNSGKIIHANFPIGTNGEVKVDGELAIDGVAGTGAKIQLAFINPGGSKTGKVLPTDHVTDVFDDIEATCIDVGNPCVFVKAEDMGVGGGILADEIEAKPALLSRLDGIRRKAAVAMKIAETEDNVPGSIPKIAMVSRPHKHILPSGNTMGEEDCDLVARAISVGQPHRAVPITVAMALSVASTISGSIVNQCTSNTKVDLDGVTIGHNSGSILVTSQMNEDGTVKQATVFRTARRIMDGTIYWKS